MKSWHIWDFPDNLYVLLNKSVHEYFFSQMFNKFGGKRPYARFLGLSQMTMKQYWKGYTKKKGVKYIQYIPLWVFKKSCKTKDLKRKIEKGIGKIRVRGGIPILNFNLNIKESPELYRIVAHLIGDGFAGELKTPYYCNTCKRLRDQFKKDLQIFGKIKTYERTPNTTPCVMFPKTISDILRHIFKIEFIRPSKLPKEIFLSSNKCKGTFLQALFDDEGTISTNLALSMRNYNLVKEIRDLIEILGIKTNGIYKKEEQDYTIQIKSTYFKIFKTKIGFIHPKKTKNLDFALKIIERNKIQRTRPLIETRTNILKILEKKPLTTLELCHKLLFTINGLYFHLRVLEKEGKIGRNSYKNKVIWSLA